MMKFRFNITRLPWMNFRFKISHWPWEFPGPFLLFTVFFLLAGVVGLGPLIIHVIWCIQLAAENWVALVLLVVGVIVAPVGWVHGMSILLGFGGWL